MLYKNKIKEHISTRYLNTEEGRKENKSLPELYSKREDCCGCSACCSVCPVSAIHMISDEEGFLYPSVDAKECVSCFLCITVCAFKKDQKNKENIEN